MAEVVIIGAGIGGLSAALLLGRQGTDVVVCEKDPAPVPPSADEMWSTWAQPGIPQAPLGHTFLPGFRRLLAERAPDVLERVVAAGAPLVDFSRRLPGERRPEDAEMTAIMCRRAVMEGTLRQIVQEEPTVTLRCGCDVAGLIAEPSGMPGVPRVTGVRTRKGGDIAGGTVVVSAGRTAPVARWLEAIGANPPEEEADACGLICFTRYFRVHLRPGEDHTLTTALTVECLPGHMVYEIFGADSATFCVEFLPPAWDHELRGLRNEAVHMAAARLLPEIALLARRRPGDADRPDRSDGPRAQRAAPVHQGRPAACARSARDRRCPLPAQLGIRLRLRQRTRCGRGAGGCPERAPRRP